MLKKSFRISIIVFLCITFLTCGSVYTYAESGKKNKNSYQYTVKIVKGKKTIKEYTIEDIKKMTPSTIQVDGKSEDGPTLLSILKSCSITKFSKITLKNISNSVQVLTKDKINKDTLLDITNHGTVKLASKTIAKKDWIKDIVEINVGE